MNENMQAGVNAQGMAALGDRGQFLIAQMNLIIVGMRGMSRTNHHRGQKHLKCGHDWGAKYRCDKGYGAGTGAIPKELANTERRIDGVQIVRHELDQLMDSVVDASEFMDLPDSVQSAEEFIEWANCRENNMKAVRMSKLDEMHKEIEVIFKGGVDHIHCDILHRFIDELSAKVEYYEDAVEMVKNYPEACVVENKYFVMMSPVAHRELLAKIKDLSGAVEVWRKAKYEADHRQFHARADRKKAEDKVKALQSALKNLHPNHQLLEE